MIPMLCDNTEADLGLLAWYFLPQGSKKSKKKHAKSDSANSLEIGGSRTSCENRLKVENFEIFPKS
jgi:hypothetical protein